jgi:hypothetical protein
VTAFPCGLCQTGACPPEMLLSCGALFSVGAILGGTAGVAKEVLSGPSSNADGRAAMRALAAGPAALSLESPDRCLRPGLERSTANPWSDGGLTVRSVFLPEPTGTPDQTDFVAEVALRQLVLTPAPVSKSAGSEPRWALRLEAQVQMTERDSGRRVQQRVEWLSDAHPVSAWTQKEASLLTELGHQACDQLAQRMSAAVEKAWRSN